MKCSPLLRIINATRNSNKEQILRYAKRYVNADEWNIFEKCVDEEFENKNSKEENEEITALKDQLDGLYMTYLSQVSLWKSRYYDLKNKMNENIK